MNFKNIKIALAQYPITAFTQIQEWQKHVKNWVEKAVENQAYYLIFPEYGAMELTSLLSSEARADLSQQAQKLLPFKELFEKTYLDLAVQYKVYIVAPSFPVYENDKTTLNRVFLFSPDGQIQFQDKLHMTRFEEEEWNVQAGPSTVKIFRTKHFNFSIMTCFDIEFALPSLVAAHAGAYVLFAPSCTETIKGANRVHIGARARALENQLYVGVSQVVGVAEWSPAVDINYGFAALYGPPDVGFEDSGEQVCGEPQLAKWIYAEVKPSHVEKVRKHGAVLNFKKHEQIFTESKLLEKLPYKVELIEF